MSLFDRLPTQVQIVEVGPRDGLQNEAGQVAVADKVRFVDMLTASGLRRIEATSFVSPRAVPQLADAEQVLAGIQRLEGVRIAALVPNVKGMERALGTGVDEIAVFTGATDSFTRHNVNMTVDGSLRAFEAPLRMAKEADVRTRGYISVCFGCPYEGAVAPAAVLDVASRLLGLGVDELSLGDTIGVATPNQIPEVVGPVLELAGHERLALHLHDTRGTALANVLAALLLGVTTFDCAAGGLGGCPYAPGASGNLATEDLLYMLHGMGIRTGVDLDAIAAAGAFITAVLGRQPASKFTRAWLSGHARFDPPPDE